MTKKGYEEITQTILSEKRETFGNLAIKVAKSVDGLQVSEQGNLQAISGNPKTVLNKLLDRFEEIAGKPSSTGARLAIAKIKAKYPKLDLPRRLA